MTKHINGVCIFERKKIMGKYVKFTEGECNYLTRNKVYELMDGNTKGLNSMLLIKSDQGDKCFIPNPDGRQFCYSIGSHWDWCDENGNIV